MNQQLKDMQAYVQSEQGATAIAAGVITTAGGVALGYFGGKAAVATACMVGGGLMAIATTFGVAQLGVRSMVRGYGWASSKLAEKKPEQRPEPTQRVATA